MHRPPRKNIFTFILSLVFTLICLSSFATETTTTESPAPAEEKGLSISEPAPNTDVETSTPPPPEEQREGFPVTYHEQTAFRILAPAHGQAAEIRAKEATKALRSALEAKQPANKDAAMVEVTQNGQTLTLRVRGYLITTLLKKDAEAAGFQSVSDYRDYIQSLLSNFVSEQFLITRIQSGLLKFFWSVFLALIGFLILRKVRQLFDQADHLLDEKRGSLKPVTVLSENLLSGEALGGLLAFGLGIGRILTYLVTIITTLIAILSQFDFASAMIKNFLGNAAEHIFTGLESLFRGIPSLLLAVLLIIVLQGGLKVLDLFLKGIKSERITWKLIPPMRVPVVHVLGATLLFIILAPLIVGALFGRFHTPIEIILLALAGAIFLGAVPMLASYSVGAVVLWRQGIQPGDWIEVGASQGEVATVRMDEIRIVPVDGGTIAIPMFSLLTQPVRRLDRTPTHDVCIRLLRDRPIGQILQSVEQSLPEDIDFEVELTQITKDHADVAVRAPALYKHVRHKIVRALADASDHGKLQLAARQQQGEVTE